MRRSGSIESAARAQAVSPWLDPDDRASQICQSCGACCAFSAEWPRFTIEDNDVLDLIPAAYTISSGMRCDGDRCSALVGAVGQRTACSIYAVRPEVCRVCQPGDPECDMAREKFGFPPVDSTRLAGPAA